MRPDRVIVLPMLVVGVALLLVAPVLPLAGLALVATAAAAVRPGHFVFTRNEQALVGVVALSVGILLPRALAPETLPLGAISDGMYALGLAAQLSAVVRLHVQRPVGGAAVTGALGLVALAAAGRASTAGLYPAFIALFLLTTSWAVAADDAGRPRLRDLGLRHAVGAALVAGLTALTVLAVDVVLPPAHARLIARLMQGMGARTGFTEDLQLGEMRGLAMSSELVGRVRGAPVDHLRGGVLRAYMAGRWSASGNTPREVLEIGGPQPEGEDAVEIELPGRTASYPLPLGAAQVWASSSVAEVEKQRILRPSSGHRAKRIAFVPGDATTALGGSSDVPSEIDLEVPRTVRPVLREVLRTWEADGVAPRVAVQAIQRHLTNDYAYSLEFQRTPRLDPVVDFLTLQRRGHCEYFASAAALLARTAGIPARVIAGYRVTERSPLADYAVVRERDAHAWTEVFLDGRWETLDTTPGGPLGAVAQAPMGSALLDLLSTSWERVDDWLAERTQLELSVVLVGLMIFFVGYRVWRNRSRAVGPARPTDLPLPAFVRLSRALESAGAPPRAASEPIERWARKVGGVDLGGDTAAAAASALADYAALRYGAPRSEVDVERRLIAAATAVESRRRPRASASP